MTVLEGVGMGLIVLACALVAIAIVRAPGWIATWLRRRSAVAVAPAGPPPVMLDVVIVASEAAQPDRLRRSSGPEPVESPALTFPVDWVAPPSPSVHPTPSG